jgi:hypothetical protein
MARSLLASLLLAGFVPGSMGCTALDKMQAPDLHGAPDSTGLVVVEADCTVIAAFLGIRSSATPVGGILARVDGAKETAKGGATSGHVVFSNLSPGKWQLVMVEAEWQTGNSTWENKYGVPLPSVADFTFDVRAGEPVYVRAQIEQDDRSDTRGVRFSRRVDPEAERKAWKWMSDVYENTAWGPIFRAKLGASGGGG